jgi:hypothetical protein
MVDMTIFMAIEESSEVELKDEEIVALDQRDGKYTAGSNQA